MGTREDFEKWYSDEGKSQRAIERHGEGYKLAQANSAWETWKVAVSVEREACAVAAWMAGMDAHSKSLGMPCDARGVGSAGANAIRTRSND